MFQFLNPFCKLNSFCKLAIFAVLAVIVLNSLAIAQDHQAADDVAREVEKDEVKQKEDNLLDGNGIRSIGIQEGGNAVPGTKRSVYPGGANRAQVKDKSITDLDGRRTISIDKSEGQIIVKIIRRYSPNEHAQIVAKHPELADYIELFPTEIDGSEIELTLAITRSYKAKTAKELEKKDSEAFAVYRRYHRRLFGKDWRAK